MIVLFKAVISLSLMGSILAAAILVCKLLFKNRFSAGWHYYIWLLLMLRLIIPYSPQIPLPSLEIPDAFVSMVLKPGELQGGVKGVDPAAVPAAPGGHLPAGVKPDKNEEGPVPQTEQKIEDAKNSGRGFTVNLELLGILWGVGGLGMLLYMAVFNRRLHQRIRRQPLCQDEKVNSTVNECRAKLNIRMPIPVIYDPQERSPYLLGYFRPKLVIPAGMAEQLSQEELRHIFLHELTHLKRKDILVSWLAMLVQVLHWFNPVIRYAFYRMKQDCELACDAAVLIRMNAKERSRYGQTLINLARYFSQTCSLPGTTGFVKKSQVKRRIIMISQFKKRSLTRTLNASLVALLLVGIGLQTGCSITEKQKRLGAVTEAVQAGKEATPTDKAADKNKTLIEEFNNLIGKNARLPEVAEFIAKNLSSVSSENAAVMVNKLEELQKGYLDKLSDKYYNGDVMQKKLIQQFKQGNDMSKIDAIQDKELKDLLVETRDSGYKVETAEGTYFPIIDYTFFKKYSAKVTPDLKDYIDLMAVESDKVPVKDAGLMINWDEILKRAMNQEKFLNTHKNSVKAAEVKEKRNQYLSFLLFGTNNTPLFSYETKTMVPEARNTYLNAVKNAEGSTVLKILTDYMELLKKSDYKFTDAVDQFRKAQF